MVGCDSKETLERWTFNVEADKEVIEGGSSVRRKSMQQINSEIRAIIRQITASVTFLPLLDEPCSFDMEVFAKKSANVPEAWEETQAKYINNCEEVKLRSFSTKIHKVDAAVSYRLPDLDDV